LTATAEAPLSDFELKQSLHRLQEMTYCNVRETHGDKIADQARSLFQKVDPASLAELPSYSDGRMAPHEWLDANGRILKTDVWGHQFDHTFPGPQPILWDIAGAIIEWQMPPDAIHPFLSPFPSVSSLPPLPFSPCLLRVSARHVVACFRHPRLANLLPHTPIHPPDP
jgi:hypothetical protein